MEVLSITAERFEYIVIFSLTTDDLHHTTAPTFFCEVQNRGEREYRRT